MVSSVFSVFVLLLGHSSAHAVGVLESEDEGQSTFHSKSLAQGVL